MIGLLELDRQLFVLINGLDLGAFGDIVMRLFSLAANLPGVVLAVLCAGVLYYRERRVGVAFIAVMLLTVVVNQGLKYGFDRSRPLAEMGVETPLDEGPAWGESAQVGEIALRVAPLYSRSFPSGHAQFAFTWLVFLGLYWRRGAPLLMTAAVMVAISRVYVGVHYPLDVVVGGLVGAGLATAAYLLARRGRTLLPEPEQPDAA